MKITAVCLCIILPLIQGFQLQNEDTEELLQEIKTLEKTLQTAQARQPYARSGKVERQEEEEVDDGEDNDSFLERDGILVDKPDDRNVCLLRNINSSAECFDEEPVTEEVDPDIRQFCAGRELVILEPTTCDDGTESEKRWTPKRSSCTRWTYTISESCRCCARLSFVCVKRCCNRDRVIWTKKTIEGYERTFTVKV